MATESVSSTISSIASSVNKATSSTTTSGSFSYKLYKRTVISPVKPSVEDAAHIGYLDENKSALEVQGTLTRDVTEANFRFAFRKGDDIKLSTNMNKGVRVQILDSSGLHVVADSGSTDKKLKEAYQQLTEGDIKMKTGVYVMKVTYAKGANKNTKLNFDLTLTSGTSYKEKYKTLAQATTRYNALLEGNDLGVTATARTSAANLLTEQLNSGLNIFDFLA